MDAVDRYIRLALEPDLAGLARLLDETIEEVGPLAGYDELVRPALVEVGRRWERDELTVGDEHLITALTEQVLTDLSRRHTGSDHVAVVACTPANRHRVGLLMVTDALGLAGWQPIVMAAQTPALDIARTARDRGAQLIALSVGLEVELDDLADQLDGIREVVGAEVPILLGGGPLARHPEGFRPPAGVTVCLSAHEAHAQGSRLLGLVGSSA